PQNRLCGVLPPRPHRRPAARRHLRGPPGDQVPDAQLRRAARRRAEAVRRRVAGARVRGPAAGQVAPAPRGAGARAGAVHARGAVTAVRWMQGEASHGLVLDSGTVTVTPVAGHLTVRAQGSGLEYSGARRASVDAVFEQMTLAAETTACGAAR